MFNIKMTIDMPSEQDILKQGTLEGMNGTPEFIDPIKQKSKDDKKKYYLSIPNDIENGDNNEAELSEDRPNSPPYLEIDGDKVILIGL